MQLRGFQKGIDWQRSYLAACITGFFVEIFVNETTECVWINFFVPSLVKDEVWAVAKDLSTTIGQLCMLEKRDDHIFLDVPKYLFISANVAKAFPHLLESVIVRSYESHLPGTLAPTQAIVTQAELS